MPDPRQMTQDWRKARAPEPYILRKSAMRSPCASSTSIRAYASSCSPATIRPDADRRDTRGSGAWKPDVPSVCLPAHTGSVPDRHRTSVDVLFGYGGETALPAAGDALGGPGSGSCIEDVVGRNGVRLAKRFGQQDACCGQERPPKRLASPALLGVRQRISARQRLERHFWVHLVDTLRVRDPAGTRLAELRPERIRLPADPLPQDRPASVARRSVVGLVPDGSRRSQKDTVPPGRASPDEQRSADHSSAAGTSGRWTALRFLRTGRGPRP